MDDVTRAQELARKCCEAMGGRSTAWWEEVFDNALRALSAAGLAIYDTRTHAAVPREPTEAMERAGGQELDMWDSRFDSGRTAAAVAYAAMLAATESPEDKP